MGGKEKNMVGQKVLLGGRYRLVERVGEGGMAIVYRGVDERLGREVAIKVLRSEYADDEAFVARFEREARAAARLNHPHVAAVFDTGYDGQWRFIVMELLQGGTLKEHIRRRGGVKVGEALRIAREAGEALAYAHGQGVIHRDIKPQNILFTEDGRTKVTDFGIARAVTEASVTDAGTVLGSVHYLSPEQAQGKEATPASDLYSLGVVLYEMLTGRVPYQGDSAVGVAVQHVAGRYVPARQFNAEVTEQVERIIQRAMAVNPQERYATAEEMVEDLQRALETWQRQSGRETATVRIQTETRPIQERVGDKEGRSTGRAWRWGIALVILGAIGAGLGLGIGSRWFATFPSEEGSVGGAVATVEVPNIVGLDRLQAEQVLSQCGLWLVVGKLVESEVDEGVIVGQEPQAGSIVETGRVVRAEVSKGEEWIEVPNVIGKTVEEARRMVEEMGLELVEVASEASEQVAEGYILRQAPMSGIMMALGERIEVVVSAGGGRPTVERGEPEPSVVMVPLAEEGGRVRVKVLILLPKESTPRKVRITYLEPQGQEVTVTEEHLVAGTKMEQIVEAMTGMTLRVYVDGTLFAQERY